MRWLRVVLFLVLSACGSNVARIENAEADRLLRNVHDGQSTRAELSARFGIVDSIFEDDRIDIYIYPMQFADGNLKVADIPENTQYQLVLVFGMDQVLERHSLIRVR
jgi:hypothetical protein